MTTNSPPVAAAPRRQGTGAGRVLAIVAAVLLLIMGVCLALGGTALMAAFGTDGKVSTDRHPVASPTAAVVTDVASIRDTADVADVLGTPVANFAADGGNSSGLFLGIGPVAEVDRYLAGVEVDQAVDFEVDPYSLTLARRDGARTAATPPARQDFWVASATGTDGFELSWPVRDGNYRMVLMNADGAAGVNSRLSVGVGLGGMFGLSLGLLIGGAVLILLAVALLVATRPRPPAAAASGYPYAPPVGAPQPAGNMAYGVPAPSGAPPGQTPPAEPTPPVREPRP